MVKTFDLIAPSWYRKPVGHLHWWRHDCADSRSSRAARRAVTLIHVLGVGSVMTLINSLQGVRLSPSERRSLELRQRAMAAVNQSVLQQQVVATLQALEQHKEQGAA
ncbi:hypothetical protein P4G46_16160 [Pseudomonas aeruginosa]|uniref:hypothetical protein n=1 Tax=Pseudomonas aeruginosa TaxID=287 RepID=UPI00283A8E5B|nr:hypothetical protein [Pseudomonas aeruginosa]WMU88460.1 hypothetical protein P4G46_16160 [Pseudomonas aeruginosa]